MLWVQWCSNFNIKYLLSVNVQIFMSLICLHKQNNKQTNKYSNPDNIWPTPDFEI